MKEDRRGYGSAGSGNVKYCHKCATIKSILQFYRCSARSDGLQTACKACFSVWNKSNYAINKEHRAVANCKWKKKNRERVNESARNRAAANKEMGSARCKAWRKKNLEYDAFRVKYRKAMVIRAIPTWVNLAEIRDAYKEAREFGLHVDHIVPLTSGIVCGLHVFDNLQLLPQSQNAAKGNRWWPDHPSCL